MEWCKTSELGGYLNLKNKIALNKLFALDCSDLLPHQPFLAFQGCLLWPSLLYLHWCSHTIDFYDLTLLCYHVLCTIFIATNPKLLNKATEHLYAAYL